MSWLSLPAPHKSENRGFIKFAAGTPLFLPAMGRGLPGTQLFEHADLAVGLDERLPAALGLGGNFRQLCGELPQASRQDNFIPMRVQEGLNVAGARRLELAAADGHLRLLAAHHGLLLAQQRLGAERFRQIGSALIAIGDSQSEQRFEAKVEHGSGQ
jgi:hypothetical protein